MGNPFVHAELMSTDSGKAKSFFGQLFDWKFEEMKGEDGFVYTLLKVGENAYGVGGGMMNHPIPHAPSTWVPYVLVDDLKAYTDKAVSLGATLMKDVTEVPGMGSFTIVSSPATGMLGLWKTAQAH